MERQELINRINKFSDPYDILVIGGGATGLGIAVDAASRGFRTLLLEQSDFAKGTSSRSTKLVHGGVRYLQQGNIKLVMEALRERGTLRKNAPHIVKNQSFIVPNYKWWEGPYYGLGLKVYDWMSGTLGLGASTLLSREEVLELAPTLDASGLRGGVLYHDGQFDDARLAINLAQTALEQGALPINYCRVDGIMKVNGRVSGVLAVDQLTGNEFEISGKVIINATGVFSDGIQQLDNPTHQATITPSQGIHIVLDKSFLPGKAAIMIPHTDDGRVLFAVPWHNHIIVGTTDTLVSSIDEEPKAASEEIEFLLEHASRYLTKDPSHSDIRSIFAGLRPLVRTTAKRTAEISRDHSILVSDSGLISILGGKWTTYRKMAEDAVNMAIRQGNLQEAECVTATLQIHGAIQNEELPKDYYYGTDTGLLRKIESNEPGMMEKIHPDHYFTKAQVVMAVRNEFCMTVEDFLARRIRLLLLDAKAAIAAAPVVAEIMRKELNEIENWKSDQVRLFNDVASQYLPPK